MADLELADWDLLVRQAHQAGLLARLGCRADELGVSHRIPEQALHHLRSAMALVQAQHRDVQREVGHIVAALQGLEVPIALLKGAAYVMAGGPAAQGRGLTDIDIMVPREAIGEVEERLRLAGWLGTHPHAHDQRYYRQWMHEIPPLVHPLRGTTLDVHHTILPPLARLKPRAEQLWPLCEPVQGWPSLRVLGRADRILHSLAHLLCNEDLSHGLRDLSDIDLMLRHGAGGSHDAARAFCGAPDPAIATFWTPLIERAVELDLHTLLDHALHLAVKLLHTPVPPEVLEQAREAAAARSVGRRLVQALWSRGLDVPHPSVDTPVHQAARGLLYLRAHWARLPPGLMLRHAAVKLGRAAFSRRSETAVPA